MLTVSRVQCIPTGTASTRGEYLEFNRIIVQPTKEIDFYGSSKTHLERRSGMGFLADMAADFSKEILPDGRELPGRARDYLSSILSAMYALNVVDSGFNTTAACMLSQSVETRYRLTLSGLDGDQVRDILCWVANNGYDFNTTRAELYSTLQASIYALDLAGGFTQNRTQVCQNLDLFRKVGGFLGIDTQGYEQYVCTNIPTPTTLAPLYPVPTSYIPVPYVINGTTMWGPPSGTNGPNGGGFRTRGPPFSFASTGFNSPANFTFHPTGTGNPAPVTGNRTWAHPTGTAAGTGSGINWSATPISQVNGTWVHPTITGTAAASDQPTGFFNETVTAMRLPHAPNHKQFFPATSTTVSRVPWFKRY
jgi:hypothetical protein